jgi:hypothetical protein
MDGPRRTTTRCCPSAVLSTRDRTALLWGLLFFVAANVGLLATSECFWPGLRDPEFGYKLGLLRGHLEREPQRPLLVLLGSSRTGLGFRPGVLPPYTATDGRVPLVFNFSEVGSGPLSELVCLHRLLRKGIRPDWLAIEVHALLLARQTDQCGKTETGWMRLSAADLAVVKPYAPDPERLARRWYGGLLSPWYVHRSSLMNRYAPDCLPWCLRQDQWRGVDEWGWNVADEKGRPRDAKAVAFALKDYGENLQHFQVQPAQDLVLRDMLALCRERHIPVVLYLTPESQLFQSWYAPATRARIDEYLTRLSKEQGVPVVDARSWVPEEYFWDGHHLDARGARVFSRRFGEEVLPALYHGRLDEIRPVLAPVHSPGIVRKPLEPAPASPPRPEGRPEEPSGGLSCIAQRCRCSCCSP